ncbi:DUF6265 family protein [Chitinophaga barathri]|uniref:DUF6265 domain-containing protein n=1 Tax=Chitinophaga barathri TaxID=1647451 RepID=A0A3N4M7X3_9BACT|nr:DUF6265 family protein [Chitinophaga barathri]RPD39365.1 hypothetical protein EG028_19775 [Chitinophaga barathri]
MKIYLPAILCCCLFNGAEKQIGKAAWLIGTWENKTSRGVTYETWNKLNEDEFQGKSYALKGKDTVVFETVQLLQKNDRLYYIPVVTGQNAGLPVTFTLKQGMGAQLVFENPAHDFPQTVSYQQINADSLVAEISGNKNGQFRKISFPMRRVK